MKSGSPLIMAATFVWIGFVAAISFMEAPLKFQAPGITLPLGLGIGRLVFSTLNKVEWVLALGIIAALLHAGSRKITLDHIVFFVPLLILILQTTWLLPALDARAALHINGDHPAGHSPHILYVIAEIFKLAALAVFGVRQFSYAQ